jgi:hypothetical protein
MIFTRRHKGYGHWTGNSSRAGIDARLTVGTRIGSDGKLYQQFRNKQTGELEWLSPDVAETKIIAIPD